MGTFGRQNTKTHTTGGHLCMKGSASGRGRGGGDRRAKQWRGRRLARESRLLEGRLAAAVTPNGAGPVLGRANIVYELAGRARGVAHGGMGLIARLVAAVGLAAEINASLRLLRQHRPYFESDHVLNVAYNALCGGRRLD